jgi:hypothetical protein
MAVPEHHIREGVASYVSGEISLAEFQEWFAPRAWEILAEDGPASDVVSDVELLLAEFSGGQGSEHALREALKEHASVAPGGIVLVSSPVDWVSAVVSQPWSGVTGFYRWSTSAAGAELGNTTVDGPLAKTARAGVERAA